MRAAKSRRMACTSSRDRRCSSYKINCAASSRAFCSAEVDEDDVPGNASPMRAASEYLSRVNCTPSSCIKISAIRCAVRWSCSTMALAMICVFGSTSASPEFAACACSMALACTAGVVAAVSERAMAAAISSLDKFGRCCGAAYAPPPPEPMLAVLATALLCMRC